MYFRRLKNTEKLWRNKLIVVNTWKKSLAVTAILTAAPLTAVLIAVYGFGLGESNTKAQAQTDWTKAHCPTNAVVMAGLAPGTKPSNWSRFEETHSNVPVWLFKSVDDQGNLTPTEPTRFRIPFGVFEYAYHSAPPTLADGLSVNSGIIASQGTWYCLKTQ